MTAVQHATRVHERTVQQAEQHAAPRPRRRATPRVLATPVVTKPVAHPLAWATALRLAGGDVHRLRVVNYTTVVVD